MVKEVCVVFFVVFVFCSIIFFDNVMFVVFVEGVLRVKVFVLKLIVVFYFFGIFIDNCFFEIFL